MICFGIKTDQEVKEKGICGSHFKKNKKKQNKQISKEMQAVRVRNRKIKIFFLFFSSLTSLFDIRKSDR